MEHVQTHIEVGNHDRTGGNQCSECDQVVGAVAAGVRAVGEIPGHKEANDGLVNTIEDIKPELATGEMLLLDSTKIKSRELHRRLGIHILIECAHKHDWQRCEEQVVEHHKSVVKQK